MAKGAPPAGHIVRSRGARGLLKRRGGEQTTATAPGDCAETPEATGTTNPSSVKGCTNAYCIRKIQLIRFERHCRPLVLNHKGLTSWLLNIYCETEHREGSFSRLLCSSSASLPPLHPSRVVTLHAQVWIVRRAVCLGQRGVAQSWVTTLAS